MEVTVKIEGLAETERKLRLLPDRVGKRAMRRALRRGANTIRNAARDNVKRLDDPRSPEQIWKNIVVQGIRPSREKANGGPTMRVGVLGGARNMSAHGEFGGAGRSNPGGDTWYWRLLEFGTSTIPAKAFMRQAMANTAEKAFSTTADAMDTEINKELDKLR